MGAFIKLIGIVMNRVSFKVAKALKEAGYPQGTTRYLYAIKNYDTYKEGDIIDTFFETWTNENVVGSPFELDVWLWLWREKQCAINLQLLSYPCVGWAFSIECVDTSCLKPIVYDTQEDAIIAAIEYLVDNCLIK